MNTSKVERRSVQQEGNGAKVIPLRRRSRPCPICGQPATRESRPFCSRRCADLDLGKWLNGTYRIETEEVDGDGDEPD